MTNIETILNRKQHSALLQASTDKHVLILGGKGSIGKALAARLTNCTVTDIEEIDVRFPFTINPDQYGKVDVVINLAGAKHAPEGEVNPLDAVQINTVGAYNAIRAAQLIGAHYVQASTCKAANPETVYGASKLIAERMTINAGFTVARFFNVVETQGNVFEIWEKQEVKEVMPGRRFFIGLQEAVGLLIKCAELLPGRYAVNPGTLQYIPTLFNRIYKGAKYIMAALRRGDRVVEKQFSTAEELVHLHSDGLIKIKSWHD